MLVRDYSNKGQNSHIQELTLLNGISYPSDTELVMLILGKGVRSNPIQSLADDVVEKINSSNDDDLIEGLMSIEGMNESRALTIAAALELGRRRRGFLRAVIDSPKDIIPYIKQYTLCSKEHFVTATVSGAHELLNIRLVSVGTANRTLVHPREVFAEPLYEHASGIICCHNHPCGQCYPSGADIETTKILQQASSMLGIAFMDHLIITSNDYFSFLEHGLLGEVAEFENMDENPDSKERLAAEDLGNSR